MRLLFAIPEYPPLYGGGIATYYSALLPELVRQGHQVRVLSGCWYLHGGEPYEVDGVWVEPLETDRIDRLLPAYSRYAALPTLHRALAAARALWEQADGGAGYDAVEVTDWGMLFAPWIAEPGPPTLVQMHGSGGQISVYDAYPGEELAGETSRMFEGSLLAHADAVHTVSQANGRFWEHQTGRTVTVSPPPLPMAEQLDVPRGATGFVAARIQECKGPQVLAEALRRLGTEAPVVEWAGRVSAHPETEEPYDTVLARNFPSVWERTLRRVGLLDPTEVARRQAAASFVVVPSLWDVYNLTAAEAMQQGAVVVCSDGAGAIDLIDDGRNGFAVPAGDDSALADAIARAAALNDRERERMGQAARATVVEMLNPAAVATVAVERYTRLGESVPSVPPPWVRTAVAPGQEADPEAFVHRIPHIDWMAKSNPIDLLRRVPLRTILHHAATRVVSKIKP